MDKTRVSPTEAIERLFEVIREEAASNPTFARRMLDAVGMNVTFTGEDAQLAVDPILTAARQDYDVFREMFLTFKETELKKMLTGYALATDEQIKGVKGKQKKNGYVELLWEGARRKLAERKSH